MRYKDFLKSRLGNLIPQNNLLPSGFHLVGHVALLQINSELQPYENLIGNATLEYDRRIKSVAVKVGPTTGAIRKPAYRLIAGEVETVTSHTECGVLFRLDPLRLTFSQGNKAERIRIPSIIGPQEIVIDMFACVGQFALHIAKRSRASKVIAIEMNPEAYQYLLENMAINKLELKVFPVLGDCRKVHPIRVADRVIMGYLHNTISFLPYALETLSCKGGFIHMHMALEKAETVHHIDMISRICKEYGYHSQAGVRKVKMYSPRLEHNVFDIQASPA
jgi:tRNA G37 N-methylase Trm5